MKERPIIFSTPMVQAILENRKSMTRRVADLPVGHNYFDHVNSVMNKPPHKHDDDKWYIEYQTHVDSTSHIEVKCRFGTPGDKLWVRETFWIDDGDPNPFYKASEAHPEIFPKWKPSLFMPRWASRITLEITDVRVERLQEITEEDAIKEGTTPSIVGHDLDHLKYRAGFQSLWDSINGKKYPWDSNPWVWVISFKRVTP